MKLTTSNQFMHKSKWKFVSILSKFLEGGREILYLRDITPPASAITAPVIAEAGGTRSIKRKTLKSHGGLEDGDYMYVVCLTYYVLHVFNYLFRRIPISPFLKSWPLFLDGVTMHYILCICTIPIILKQPHYNLITELLTEAL